MTATPRNKLKNILDSSSKNTLLYLETWSNASDLIIFEQQVLNARYFYDTDHSEDYQLITLNTIPFYYREIGETDQYLWTDGIYLYSLQFNENFSQEIVMQIINGIEIKS